MKRSFRLTARRLKHPQFRTHLHGMPCALAAFPHGLQLVEVAEPDARLVAVLIHAAVVVLLFLLGPDEGGPPYEKLV